MKGAIILLTLLLGAPPTEVLVRQAEPLAKVAERTLGDAKAASELKALNGLASDTVPAGTTLKLPGADRARALSALAAARNAVARTEGAAARKEAETKLGEAEAHFQSARYADASRAADGAWQLVSASASTPQSFSVEVSDAGTTTVQVHSGKPVRVEAEGTTRQVQRGESVRVEKGQPPPQPAPLLAAPLLSSPAPGKKLSLQPEKGLLGPVTLAWSAVSGAQAYEVEVIPSQGEPVRMNVNTARAQLPALPAGSYRWTVRAVGQGAKSAASAARNFELVDGSLKLDVKNSTWK